MSAAEPRPNVAVFGASWAQPDSALYALSVELGKALAEGGYDVVSGGYLGTMEGVSKGAAGAGGSATGVLVPTLFPARGAEGNAFLTSRVEAPSLLARIDAITRLCPRFYIALPGTLGTLAEICTAWNIAALAPVGGYAPFRVVCWRAPWEKVLAGACEGLALPAEHRVCLVFVDSVAEALAALRAA